MEILDCRTFKCPHPVVEVRKRIIARPDSPLVVLVGDAVSQENVTRLAGSRGFSVQSEPTDGGIRLQLTPTGEAKAAETVRATGPTVVFIGAESMGSGSDELGRLLMKNFLVTLTELDQVPDAILLVNGGVQLTCEGSDSLEALQKLACMGTDIASCGLCLDYFHLREKLAVGRITNMLDIAERLLQAGRTVRP